MNYWGNSQGKIAYFFIAFPQSSGKPFSIVLQLRNGSKEKSYASFFYKATCVISNGKFFFFCLKRKKLICQTSIPSEQKNSAFIAIVSSLLSIAFRMFNIIFVLNLPVSTIRVCYVLFVLFHSLCSNSGYHVYYQLFHNLFQFLFSFTFRVFILYCFNLFFSMK